MQSYGVNQVTIIDKTNYVSYAARIIGKVDTDFKQEMKENRGGSLAVPFAVAPGEAKAMIKLTMKQTSPEILNLFTLQKSGSYAINTAGSLTATISGQLNKVGTTVLSATVGIATVAIASGQDANVGGGYYIIRAVSASTFDLYTINTASGAPNISQVIFPNPLYQKINSSPIVRGAASSTVSSNGFTFTAGSSAAAMTPGDAAILLVTPVNNFSSSLVYGQTGARPKPFELVVESQADAYGSFVIARYPNCLCFDNPVPTASYFEFAENELDISAQYDSGLDGFGQVNWFNIQP
jgi:hypothetical protein